MDEYVQGPETLAWDASDRQAEWVLPDRCEDSQLEPDRLDPADLVDLFDKDPLDRVDQVGLFDKDPLDRAD